MVAIKQLASILVFVGVAVASSNKVSACVPTDMNAVVNTMKTHLVCKKGKTYAEAGSEQYLCDSEGPKKNFEADITVAGASKPHYQPMEIEELMFTNKVAANKVYMVTSGTGNDKKTTYWGLGGQMSCTVTGSTVLPLGKLDPESVYVYDWNVSGGNPP